MRVSRTPVYEDEEMMLELVIVKTDFIHKDNGVFEDEKQELTPLFVIVKTDYTHMDLSAECEYNPPIRHP